MITSLRDRSHQFNLSAGLITLAVLALAFILGQRVSILWLGLLVACLGALVLLSRPSLGLLAMVAAALVLPLEFSTGTEVRLNTVTLFLPVIGAIWLLDRMRHRRIHVVASPVNLPLSLFVAANLLSLLIGRATFDPMVVSGGNFILVQLSQWAIFAFSALAFWLTANLITDERTLWRLTALFLLLAGGVAIVRLVPGMYGLASKFSTIAFIRAPLWALLTALAGGQLLWNRQLSLPWRLSWCWWCWWVYTTVSLLIGSLLPHG